MDYGALALRVNLPESLQEGWLVDVYPLVLADAHRLAKQLEQQAHKDAARYLHAMLSDHPRPPIEPPPPAPVDALATLRSWDSPGSPVSDWAAADESRAGRRVKAQLAQAAADEYGATATALNQWAADTESWALDRADEQPKQSTSGPVRVGMW